MPLDDEYPFHPIANEYPLMTDEQLAELAADIEANGQTIKALCWHGLVIDGRNRYLACERLGIDCQFTEWDGPEEGLRALIESLNEHRRHLSPEWLSERRKARIARVVDARRNGESLRSIAETENISEMQVRRDLEVTGATSPVAPEPQNGTVKGRDDKTYPAAPKKKPAARTKEDTPCDALGQELPSNLRDVFGDEAVGEQAAKARAALAALEGDSITRQISKRMRLYPWLKFANIQQALTDAKDALLAIAEGIESSLPHAICPRCNGAAKGCPDCRASGYVPAWRHEELQKQDRLEGRAS